jgi:predicted nucleotidyltransferase component of viral defense system
MITPSELTQLAVSMQISPMVIIREYGQLLFLKYLSESDHNHHYYFKGGTLIRLLFQGERFSEDLDFTVTDLDKLQTEKDLKSITKQIAKEFTVTLKPLDTLAGQSFRLNLKTPLHPGEIYIKIDLSFRENVIYPTSSALITSYPLIFRHLVYHYSKKEIVAEKVRALLHRIKGRDLYDLWYLLSKQTEFDYNLISQKLDYYKETYDHNLLIERINTFPKDIFVRDLASFIGQSDRDHLPELYDVIQSYLNKILTTSYTSH